MPITYNLLTPESFLFQGASSGSWGRGPWTGKSLGSSSSSSSSCASSHSILKNQSVSLRWFSVAPTRTLNIFPHPHVFKCAKSVTFLHIRTFAHTYLPPIAHKQSHLHSCAQENVRMHYSVCESQGNVRNENVRNVISSYSRSQTFIKGMQQYVSDY